MVPRQRIGVPIPVDTTSPEVVPTDEVRRALGLESVDSEDLLASRVVRLRRAVRQLAEIRVTHLTVHVQWSLRFLAGARASSRVHYGDWWINLPSAPLTR